MPDPRTDATLAAMLADPSPEARLIAADYCEERDIDARQVQRLRIEGAAAQLLDLHPRRLTVILTISRWRVYVCLMPDDTVEIRMHSATAPNWCRWRLSSEGWREYYRRGASHCSRPRVPPPGLEAAVLAVLLRRLEEIAEQRR